MAFGRVYDKESMQPIPGVNIFISDKDGNLPAELVGTATAMDGSFEIKANYFDNITFSMVGYPKKTILAYELQEDPDVILDDSGGSILDIFEVVSTSRKKPTKNIWPKVAIGFALFLIVAGIVIYVTRKRMT